MPEDYDFWKGTENCNKEGCLGYITELLNNLQNNSNLEYKIKFDESYNYTEAFLWDLNYSKLNHPEIFSVKN